jgi:hypothetical protein
LDESTIKLNVTNASIKELEDKALDASKRSSFFGRVPWEVVGKDRVRPVVERACKSLLNPLSENTLTNTSASPKVKGLVFTVEEAGQVILDPVASILRAIKMLRDFIVQGVSYRWSSGGLKALSDRHETDGESLHSKTPLPNTTAKIILSFPDIVNVLAKCSIKTDGDAIARSQVADLLAVVACDAADEVDQLTEDVGCCFFDVVGHALEIADAGDGGEKHGEFVQGDEGWGEGFGLIVSDLQRRQLVHC